jgi:hypothetical protein
VAAGAGDVTVNFYSKGDGMSRVAVQHGKLKNAAWCDKLEALQGILEG